MDSPYQPSAPTHSRRDVLRGGAAAAGGLLLAACIFVDDEEGVGETEDGETEGGETEGGERGGEAPASSTPVAATPVLTPTAAPSLLAPDQPVPDGERGVMRRGVVGEAAAPPVLSHARLVAVDPRSGAIHGDLAQRVEQAGPLDLVVQLRPDAFFHPASGAEAAEPVDAEAVAREFSNRAQRGEFLFGGVIDTIETPEADTLRLRLAAPFALLFELLGDTAAGAIRSDTRSEFGQPLGCGPFVAEGREDGGVSLRPHPRYHQRGLPLLSELRIVSAEREAALDAAFENGALDILQLDHPDSAARAAQRAGARTLTRSTRRVRGLGLSLVGTKGDSRVRFHPAFQDERVRRALFRTLDYQLISALEGAVADHPTGPVGPSFAADALPPVELAAHPLFSHDPGEARRLLEAAGVPGLEFALEAPDREPFTVLSQVLAKQLREGGFRPRLTAVPDAAWRRDLVAGDFEAILFELEPVRTPDVGLRLHSSVGLEGDFSPWGYSNPLYDIALEEALSALDPAERGRRAREAQRLLLDDVPALIPLPEPIEQIAVSSRVDGYAWETHEFNETWQAPRWRIAGSSAGRAPGGVAATVDATVDATVAAL